MSENKNEKALDYYWKCIDLYSKFSGNKEFSQEYEKALKKIRNKNYELAITAVIMNDKVQPTKHNELLKNTLIKILTTIGSIISIGFGIWHFFIPGIWNWYSYIKSAANYT